LVPAKKSPGNISRGTSHFLHLTSYYLFLASRLTYPVLAEGLGYTTLILSQNK